MRGYRRAATTRPKRLGLHTPHAADTLNPAVSRIRNL